ncbi:MAG: response regulator [Dehalococcoidales bacterium]|jgi:OmpR family response regulator RpaB|nr:response regulator [Dehalococcoidales bacterium]
MTGKILVVDDDSDVRDALTMVLESRGYQVITAQDGIEGLACLKAEKPDLMILDLLMPKMDGFGVMKELRDPRWAEFSEMPILIQTAVREEASRRRYELETGVALGAADYVEKPASPDILLARVKKLIKRKQEV